jgi:hypothetical protein
MDNTSVSLDFVALPKAKKTRPSKKCELCDRAFCYSAYYKHIKDVHEKIAHNPFACELCGKVMDSNSQYKHKKEFHSLLLPSATKNTMEKPIIVPVAWSNQLYMPVKKNQFGKRQVSIITLEPKAQFRDGVKRVIKKNSKHKCKLVPCRRRVGRVAPYNIRSVTYTHEAFHKELFLWNLFKDLWDSGVPATQKIPLMFQRSSDIERAEEKKEGEKVSGSPMLMVVSEAPDYIVSDGFHSIRCMFSRDSMRHETLDIGAMTPMCTGADLAPGKTTGVLLGIARCSPRVQIKSGVVEYVLCVYGFRRIPYTPKLLIEATPFLAEDPKFSGVTQRILSKIVNNCIGKTDLHEFNISRLTIKYNDEDNHLVSPEEYQKLEDRVAVYKELLEEEKERKIEKNANLRVLRKKRRMDDEIQNSYIHPEDLLKILKAKKMEKNVEEEKKGEEEKVGKKTLTEAEYKNIANIKDYEAGIIDQKLLEVADFSSIRPGGITIEFADKEIEKRGKAFGSWVWSEPRPKSRHVNFDNPN